MSYNSRSYDAEDRYLDSTDDHTLRASDGDFFEQRSPPGSRHGANGDDTGDVFLKIASEEAARNSETNNASDRPTTTVSEKKKRGEKSKEKNSLFFVSFDRRKKMFYLASHRPLFLFYLLYHFL